MRHEGGVGGDLPRAMREPHDYDSHVELDPDPENIDEVDQKRQALVQEQMRICWGISVDEWGAANIERMGQLLYRVWFDQRHNRIGPDSRFPGREELLRSPLPQTHVELVPDEHEFIATLQMAMTEGIDFREALYPGAVTEFQGLLRKGFVVMWSAGDVEGIPGQGLDGTGQQTYKIERTLGPAARQVIEEKGGAIGERVFEGAELGSGLGEAQYVGAALGEDKKPNLVDIAQDFRLRGIRDAAIFEDQLPNLAEARRVFEQFGLHVIPVWVRQGRRKGRVPSELSDRTEAELEAEFNAVDSVDQINERLAELGYGNPPAGTFGSALDYDGVLGLDQKRERLQAEAMWRACIEKGWFRVD